MKKLLTLALLAVAGAAFADPFSVSGGPITIPDNNVNGTAASIGTWGGSGGNVTGITNVTLFGFTHTWIGDVRAWVEHNGQIFTLFQRPLGDAAQGSTVGDSSNVTGDYTFDLTSPTTLDQASVGGTSAFNIPAGSYRAAHQAVETSTGVAVNDVMSDGSVFNGGSVLGDWTLHMTDGASGDTGGITSWTLNGTYSPVPEPASMVVLGVGALALLRRRKKA